MEIFDPLLFELGFNITLADAVAMTLSIIGIVLNATKRISCWPVWIGANVFWIIFGLAVTLPSIVVMNIVFFFGNSFGWYQWKKDAVVTETTINPPIAT